MRVQIQPRNCYCQLPSVKASMMPQKLAIERLYYILVSRVSCTWRRTVAPLIPMRLAIPYVQQKYTYTTLYLPSVAQYLSNVSTVVSNVTYLGVTRSSRRQFQLLHVFCCYYLVRLFFFGQYSVDYPCLV